MDADAAGVDRSLFAAVYEQIADIDKDLSPDQLAHFTESALNLLNDESFNMMVEDDDDASTTTASSTPAKERFSLKSSSSSSTPRKRSSVTNPETSQRTRHLETRYFKIRDYVRAMLIRVRHIGTDVNVSDFFTKALPIRAF